MRAPRRRSMPVWIDETLRDWVHRYNAEGLAGLYVIAPIPGRSRG